MRNKPRPFAKRSLGQNFLVDGGVIGRILDEFQAGADDTVLEIGPGRGALTEGLIEKAGRLFVLEFDDVLADELVRRFSGHSNFTLIKGDVLNLDLRSIAPGRPLRLISNLPYNISTAVLQKLFECKDVISDCVLMFQREVAERIAARPGSKERGYLTVMTEANFEVTHLFDVSPAAFRPSPKVWSSVVRLTPTETVVQRPAEFRSLVMAGFAQKRKTIANNLKAFAPSFAKFLEKAAIDPSRRAETLTLDEWFRLHDAVGDG